MSSNHVKPMSNKHDRHTGLDDSMPASGEVSTGKRVAEKATAAEDLAGSSRRRVFVLGHQRSGTSAVASLLSRATGLELIDDPTWTYTRHVRVVYQQNEATERYLTEHLQGFDEGILKAPSLTPIAEALQRQFPGSQFVVVVREPKDNLAATIEWRRHRDANSQDDFWDHSWLGLRATDRIELLASRWQAYINAASELSDPIWFSYEAFCRDKPAAITRLCDRLRIRQLKFIDESVDRQFKKNFGDRTIKGVHRWRSDLTEAEAQLIEKQCGPLFRSLPMLDVATEVAEAENRDVC